MLGLTISEDDGIGVGRVVRLLEKGNEYQSFRYFNLNTVVTADLSWVREVIGVLVGVVEPHVRDCSEPVANTPGPAVALMAIHFRPSRQTS
jgi:hypothetical protein